jgi:hypothetical protein
VVDGELQLGDAMEEAPASPPVGSESWSFQNAATRLRLGSEVNEISIAVAISIRTFWWRG